MTTFDCAITLQLCPLTLPGKPYRLHVTDADHKAYQFLMGKYSLPTTMYNLHTSVDEDSIIQIDDGYVLYLQEHEAWEIQQAWEDDDQLFHCLSDDCAQRILALLNVIV